MIQDELKNLVQGLESQVRPSVLSTPLGPYVIDGYKPLIPGYERQVSSINSLAEAVIEEARRRGNVYGKNMTVILSDKGGVFYPDDTMRKDQWSYKRVYSESFDAFKTLINYTHGHKQFLKALMALKPYIVDFASVYADYKKVNADLLNSVSTVPLPVDGTVSGKYEFSMTFTNGQQQPLRSGFSVKLPFCKGDSDYLHFDVDVLPELNDKKVSFELFCPLFAETVEQAVLSERKTLQTLLEENELEEVFVAINYN